jgi:hypothetical protein
MTKDALATRALAPRAGPGAADARVEREPASLTKPSLRVAPARADREGPDTATASGPVPRISGSFSAFRDLALSLVAQLEDRRYLLARRRTVLSQALLAELEPMTAEAQRLAKEFGSWPERPPDVVRRSDTIQKLVDLQQQVLSYLDGER